MSTRSQLARSDWSTGDFVGFWEGDKQQFGFVHGFLNGWAWTSHATLID